MADTEQQSEPIPFSPGPWSVLENRIADRSYPVILDANGVIIAYVVEHAATTAEIARAERDAALMALAPRMLEAIRLIGRAEIDPLRISEIAVEVLAALGIAP